MKLPVCFDVHIIMVSETQCLCAAALVGRLGSAQLAAVGLSGIIMIFAAVVFNFLLFITTPTVAAAVAQGDRAKVPPEPHGQIHDMKRYIRSDGEITWAAQLPSFTWFISPHLNQCY